jgi:hypothetical protein
MLLCAEDDCLVELVERRHDAKLVAFTPVSKGQQPEGESGSGAGAVSGGAKGVGETREGSEIGGGNLRGLGGVRQSAGGWRVAEDTARDKGADGGDGKGGLLRLERFFGNVRTLSAP